MVPGDCGSGTKSVLVLRLAGKGSVLEVVNTFSELDSFSPGKKYVWDLGDVKLLKVSYFG